MARRRRPDVLELPEWLLALLADEDSEERTATFRSRLEASGIVEVGYEGPQTRPLALTFRSPRFHGSQPVEHEGRERPVTHAMTRIVDELTTIDLYLRLRLAAVDMETVWVCARELARYRHVPGSPDPVPHNPYAAVEDVLDAGLVVVYARSFTGAARLGDKWLPPTGPDRDMHDALMAARGHIYAHADHTAHRSLVDTAKLFGDSGPPTLGFAFTRPSTEALGRVADVCDRQRERFVQAAAELESKVHAAISDAAG